MNSKILREIGGDTLFTQSQLRFLDDVKVVVESEFLVDDLIWRPRDEEKIAEFMEKVSAIEKNLKTIINRLKGGRRTRQKFLDTYPVWLKVRKDGIEKLREIALSLQKDRFNCNVSKLVGYSTSLLGGGVTLLSAILIPFTLGLTTPLAIAGGAMTAAGCSTAIGTSVTEIVLLKNKIGAAQEIINEDKEYFQEMNNWLEHAEKLEKALTEILEIDIVKDIFESVKGLVEKGMEIQNDLKRLNYIGKAINAIKALLPKNVIQSVPLIGIATVISVLATIFLLMLSIENRFVFDSASITIKSVIGIASLADDVFDVARLTSLFTSNAVLAKDLAKAVTRGAVAVVGMGLDVAAITLTSIDVHKGSLSPEAEKLSKAADELEEQAELLKKIYENMNMVN